MNIKNNKSHIWKYDFFYQINKLYKLYYFSALTLLIYI